MAKILVLYYSSYGHIETMASAVAEGARGEGADVFVKRVPETVPTEIAQGAHFKLDQAADICTVDELADYDAIIVGSEDGRLYCLNLTDGQERWAYEIGAAVTASPAAADGLVIVGSEDGNLYAFGKPTPKS